MANRTFDQFFFTIQKRVVRLYGVFSVAAAGAVTLQKWNYPTLAPNSSVVRTYTAAPTAAAPLSWPQQTQAGAEGIFSVTRTATGLWTVKLQDTYQRLLGITVLSSLAGGLATVVSVAENTTITSMQPATGGSVIGVALLSATGTAADPASGDRITLGFDLHDSSAP